MTFSRALGTVAMVLCMVSCDDPAEWRSRQAVGALVEATPTKAAAALERVRAEGTPALVDIEQALHGANLPGRLRLIDAMEAIGSKRALPLLRFLERWDEAKPARERAREAREALVRPARTATK